MIAAGAKVRVRLTMVADARRTHVALIDPLPAGLEPINPALAVSQTIPPPGDDGNDDAAVPFEASWFWGWNWFEHQNLRDDRAEAFSSFLPGGTYEYTYTARATTPGTFVVPPDPGRGDLRPRGLRSIPIGHRRRRVTNPVRAHRRIVASISTS